MSYTVSPIPLAAIPGVHDGTGSFGSTRWFVDPGSVAGQAKLAFVQRTAGVRTMLFAISDAVVPNWFGVAIPDGITDFSNVHIFFHPTPAQAGYVDNDYPTKAGKWPQLFYYMEVLGYQLDVAARNQVLIMPFLTNAATNCGILPANWQQIVPDILSQVQDQVTGGAGSSVTINAMAISSFSAGIVYSNSFRTTGAGVSSVLDEVWDLDGSFSTYSSLSQALRTATGFRLIQYDQSTSNDPVSFHVPLPRWADYVDAPQTASTVHGLIRDFMFLHGATISTVGQPITEPGTHTATATHTGSGSHTATATHTGSGSHTATATHTGSGSHTATRRTPGRYHATATHTGSGSHTGSSTLTQLGTHTGSGTLTHSQTGLQPTGSGGLPPGSTIPSPWTPTPVIPTPAMPLMPPVMPPVVAPATNTVTPTSPIPPSVPACTDCGCQNLATLAITGQVATVATTALTAITAISATAGCCGARSRGKMP